MRNIWAIVVGVVVLGGAAVTLYHVVGRDTPNQTVRTAAPAVPAPAAPVPAAPINAAATQNEVAVPKPDADFGEVQVTANDYVMGKADAPVTMVEYASLTCPHCAKFHHDTLPGVKKEFIDTGKVRLVYRDFPLDRVALAGSMIARCAGRDRYLAFISTFFASQGNWRRDSNPVAALGKLARLGGMSQADVDACLRNQAVGNAILQQRLDAEKTFQVDSTPTIIINGKKFSGGLTLEQFRAVVAPMLK